MFQEDTARYENQTGRFAYAEREITRLREQINDDERAYTDPDGIRRWRSNDAVIPDFVFRDACLVCPPEQSAAREAETKAFTAAYRKANANRKLSAEERFEMRAAFGPGETVVDVITGQKWVT